MVLGLAKYTMKIYDLNGIMYIFSFDQKVNKI
jgi:hypothetical protein